MAFGLLRRPSPVFASIPTIAERNGDFSALPARIYDPASTVCSAAGVCTRQAFPGNIIPQDRISPASQFLQSNLPAPSNSGLQNNYLQSVPVTDKVDINLNERNQMYVLFSHGHRSQSTPYRGNTLPLSYASTRLVDELPTIAQAKHTFVASPTFVNQVSYGLSRFNVPITNATIRGDWMTKAGVTGLPAGEAASSFPEVAWSGPNSPTEWRSPCFQ
jgi:hypothetical protein